MNSPPLSLSQHARERADARSISPAAIAAAIGHGRRFRSHGAWAYRLDRRSLAEAEQRGLQLTSFEGVHVIVSDDGTVITVFRNRRPRRVRR